MFNAVPRGASILLDIRDADFDRRQQVIDAVVKGAETVARKWRTSYKADIVYAHPPIQSSDTVGASFISRPNTLHVGLNTLVSSALLSCL